MTPLEPTQKSGMSDFERALRQQGAQIPRPAEARPIVPPVPPAVKRPEPVRFQPEQKEQEPKVQETQPRPQPVIQREERVQEHARVQMPETTVLVSELDAHIAQRMLTQPPTIEAVEERYSKSMVGRTTQHRLVLPEYFESQSHDCTWGDGCAIHRNNQHGRYAFRWVFKRKFAVDHAIDDLGWTLVNRAYFPGAPRHLFTANGAVELGDAILAFMPIEKALEMRKAPGIKSRETIAGRMTPDPDDPDYVMMTPNPGDKRYYKPRLPQESVESEGGEGAIVEGRDF